MQPPSPVAEQALAGRLAVAVVTGSDPASAMAALRARGAQRFDPVRYRFIEALARRAAGHDGSVRQLLDGKLASALLAYGERYEQARSEASQALARGVLKCPAAAAELGQLFNGGHFSALRSLATRLENKHPAGPLAGLLRHIDRASFETGGDRRAGDVEATVGRPVELKAVRDFRSTWSRLSIDQQLARSAAKLPAQTGPLNSDLLVLRSLQWMRELAPGYLSRFMSYVDTLRWLDQADLTSGLPPTNGAGAGAWAGAGIGTGARTDSIKKRKPGRGRSS